MAKLCITLGHYCVRHLQRAAHALLISASGQVDVFFGLFIASSDALILSAASRRFT